jgi:hypothetical protein
VGLLTGDCWPCKTQEHYCLNALPSATWASGAGAERGQHCQPWPGNEAAVPQWEPGLWVKQCPRMFLQLQKGSPPVL